METVENTDYVLSLVASINVPILYYNSETRFVQQIICNCVSFSANLDIIRYDEINSYISLHYDLFARWHRGDRVDWDTFHFFSTNADNIYDIDFELTRQGRGILLYKCII